jgi:AcrR family transcriptional regulator
MAMARAAVARENPALIRYHFGSKAGLLSALVDSVMYQEAVELIEQLTAVPAGDERRKQLLALHEGLPEDTDAYRNFFELIPHILRDDELQPHLRGLFDWYRKLDAWALKDAGDKEPAVHIAPMALLKILAVKLALAPLNNAFVISMNYGLGFMLMGENTHQVTIGTTEPTTSSTITQVKALLLAVSSRLGMLLATAGACSTTGSPGSSPP